MISGLIPLSDGQIKVMGLNVEGEAEKIKQIMGVCPQTNPIYPKLTVYEHLSLYSKVKTKVKPQEEREAEIDTILNDIDLMDKKNFVAGNLSGG
jgi:ATP-binding cassette, subfamily A (ABC1), member 3